MSPPSGESVVSSVIPAPTTVQAGGGVWRKTHRSHESRNVRTELGVSVEPEGMLGAQAEMLRQYAEQEWMFRAAVAPPSAADIRLCLSMEAGRMERRLAEAGFRDERYRLNVAPDRVTIDAACPAGIAMGIQTLRQLLAGQRARLSLPCMVVEDRPATVWRGMHLDVSRHFWDAGTVKRFIDLMAYHKFNLFHWHLTDDQGWRLPVDGYPRLTEIAAWRDGTMLGHDCDRKTNPEDGIRHGGFYSHEEIREIVAHAAARGIHVLPEVDVPGHVQALLTAYPEFGCTGAAPGVRRHWGISSDVLNLEPVTFRFLERVVETLAQLFPFAYSHFGGDEARTEQWVASGQIRQRRQELGIRSDEEIQGHFTRALAGMIRRHGRKMVGWDEIIENGQPDPDTVVMCWRDSQKAGAGLDRKALERGHGVVLANASHTYFDAYNRAGPGQDEEPLAICGNLPLEKVYAWHPLERIPAELRDGVFGAQAQVWTEYIASRNHLDYMVYPRACALAQVLWTGGGREPWEAFTDRLRAHLPRLDRLGVCYRPPDGLRS